jgi:hypothetical protein
MSDIYCLDTNVFIEPWNKYYSMTLCPDYWELIDNLAKSGTLFCTEEVRREIDKVDDGLKEWVLAHPYLIREVTTQVQKNLRDVLKKFPRLVQHTKDRSMADPWVIAHAMDVHAIVVTKELNKGSNTQKVAIPDVCDAFKVPWMNDFQFLNKIGVKFSASRR